jgi:hypothetical protein
MCHAEMPCAGRHYGLYSDRIKAIRKQLTRKFLRNCMNFTQEGGSHFASASRGDESHLVECSHIPADPLTIIKVLLAVMRLQIIFLPQDLTVNQQRKARDIRQKYPVRKNQEFADQNEGEGDVNGITAESKDAGRDQRIGAIRVDADAEALLERDQTPQQQHQPRRAPHHANPRDRAGIE